MSAVHTFFNVSIVDLEQVNVCWLVVTITVLLFWLWHYIETMRGSLSDVVGSKAKGRISKQRKQERLERCKIWCKPNFPKSEHFLPLDMLMYVLVTSILWFALLSYYLRCVKKSSTENSRNCFENFYGRYLLSEVKRKFLTLPERCTTRYFPFFFATTFRSLALVYTYFGNNIFGDNENNTVQNVSWKFWN